MDGGGSGRHKLAMICVQIGVEATKMVGQSGGQCAAKRAKRDALCNASNAIPLVK